MVRERRIPVAGINFGRLGFLTAARIGADSCDRSMEAILEGRYDVMERSLIRISLESGTEPCSLSAEDFYPFALNEVTLQRSRPYMVGIEVKIDGRPIPTYWADGLLVATATGSTAYSLSVGGPVAIPGSGVFIMTPIAPHNLNVRPLILPDNSRIEVLIHSKGYPTLLSADNRTYEIPEGEVISIEKASFPIRSVSLSGGGFFDALSEKLLWGEDKRNEHI